MKKIRTVFIIVFFILLMIPMFTFNREKNVVSELDNRKLMDTPLEGLTADASQEQITSNMEAYMQDRIGLRREMIAAYTEMNEALFHEMVHPSYTWGKDDYVFMGVVDGLYFQDYHLVFAQMIADLQKYCEERDIPFLFVFEPSKATVLEEHLARGIAYDNDWVDYFMKELDRLGVHYVDNTKLLEEKTEAGEMVFNKQYDAGHWNDLGAFYGVNHMLEALSEQQEGIHINTKDEFDIVMEERTVLPQSDFKISDEAPVFYPKDNVENLTDAYDAEVARNPEYPFFEYTVNPKRQEEGSPRALVFQGSYMNQYGKKFLENSFGEYIAVHDYMNVMNLDYYINIFRPDCVVFEVAEYAVTDIYFDMEEMQNTWFYAPLETFDKLKAEEFSLPEGMMTTEEGEQLYTVHVWNLPENVDYAYLETNNRVYDLVFDSEQGSFSATMEKIAVNPEDIAITVIRGGATKKEVYR